MIDGYMISVDFLLHYIITWKKDLFSIVKKLIAEVRQYYIF